MEDEYAVCEYCDKRFNIFNSEEAEQWDYHGVECEGEQ